MTETINRADFWLILVLNFLLFSYIFANFEVENRENGLHLGNSNLFDCSRFAPSTHRLIE